MFHLVSLIMPYMVLRLIMEGFATLGSSHNTDGHQIPFLEILNHRIILA